MVHLVLTMRGERTTIPAWVVCTKGIKIASTNNVVKIRVEALTSYSNLLRLLILFFDVFLLNKVVALHKIRQKILWCLEKSWFIT